MNKFIDVLNDKIIQSQKNNFGIENYDEYRFGKYPEVPVAKKTLSQNLKHVIKEILGKNKTKITPIDLPNHPIIKEYGERLQYLYERINPDSQNLLVSIIAYRMLGYKKVKLPLSDGKYWENFEKVKALMDYNDVIDPKFMHFLLKRINMKTLGYDIDFYFTEASVVTDFINEQYCYKTNDQKRIVEAEKGDVVLDIGGCWGDTALYFASKVGNTGKVHSFEFIPGNLKIYKRNISLNPHLKDIINVIEHPVSDVSNQTIFYADNGPGSTMSEKSFEGQTGSTTTLSIDDFVSLNNIDKLDYIKMDIEGAEPYALKGAVNTLKRFRPKLAIAIYHSMDDMVNIQKWLDEQNLGYKFYIGHYKIHVEETILFAKVED